jgi:hypothetical protein
MRIYGPNGTAVTGSTQPGRRAASGSFSVPGGEPGRGTSASGSVRTIGGIDALLALQGVDDATERRRRAVQRGRTALDVLDEIKIGMLSGQVDQAAFLRLKAVAADLKGESGIADLDRVLADIELRVEVELAKAGVR